MDIDIRGCELSFWHIGEINLNTNQKKQRAADETIMGKLLISHRSTIYPCYIPVLGEFNRSWSYKTYPSAKVQLFV